MLDPRMAEFAGDLPENYKLRGSNGKYVLKRAIELYVPAEVLTRPKAGFVVPLADWLRTPLKRIFEEAVLQPAMEEFVNLEPVRGMWSAHLSGFRDFGRPLWSLLMLALWNTCHRKTGSHRREASRTTDRMRRSRCEG